MGSSTLSIQSETFKKFQEFKSKKKVSATVALSILLDIAGE